MPPRPQDVNDFYLGPPDKIQYGLKLAHVRHKHTDYEEELKQLQAEKDKVLKELEIEKAEAIRQFALRRKEINDEFEKRYLNIRQECRKKAEDILRNFRLAETKLTLLSER